MKENNEGNYSKLLSKLPSSEPAASLEARIMKSINVAERGLARKRVWAFGGAMAAALALTVSSGILLYDAFMQSGFYQYLKLAFSAFSGDLAVYSYWRELSVALIDSLPVWGTIIFLSAVGFLVWSGANAMSSTRRLILQA